VAKAQTDNTLPGDANQDLKVDGIDYVIWFINYGRSTSRGNLDGDFDLNGTVGREDYDVWVSNYGRKIIPTTSPSPTQSQEQPTSTQSVTPTSSATSSSRLNPQVAGYSTSNENLLAGFRRSFVNFWESLFSSFKKAKRKVLPEPKVINFKDAREYAGREKVVEGEIKEILNNRKAVYLGFKKPHNGEFVVRIMSEDWSNFPDIPDKIYHEGQKVKVTGKIQWYQGDPVIYVKNPSQIEVVSE